jgi:hypothetical protein
MTEVYMGQGNLVACIGQTFIKQSVLAVVYLQIFLTHGIQSALLLLQELLVMAERFLGQEYLFGTDVGTFLAEREEEGALLKLIDRETGSDSYALVKDLRGSFRAAFYQTVGKIFGYNLRTKYDPVNDSEDRVIERIIFAIETKKI